MASPQEPQPRQDEPQRATRWLSEDFSRLLAACREDPALVYDLVVVGSGYGGAMAAAQLAGLQEGGRDVRVCVLERGREILPGAFPSRFSELAGQVRFSTNGHPEPRGPREGLFDFRVGDGVAALVGNGLGGGSLINAAVMEAPRWDAFDSRLPASVVADLDGAFFDEVKALVGARATDAQGAPCDNTIALHPAVKDRPLPKREALADIATQAGGVVRDAAITIEMRGQAADGVRLNACTLCGDCMTGCNVGARRSLDTNLLVRARRRGAEIYTGAAVLQVEFVPHGNGPFWEVEVVHTDQRVREKQGPAGVLLLRTRKLILAAGTFGSTEILLRSQKDQGLRFSPHLGARLSCNGDNLAAVTHTRREAGSVARETDPLVGADGQPSRHVGPTITGILPLMPQAGRGFLVQEFAVPAPLRRLFAELVTTGHVLRRLGERDDEHHGASQARDPLAVDEDAIARTSLVGLIGHDDARGVLSLPGGYARSARSSARQTAYEGGLKVRWPDAAGDTQVQRAFERFEQAAARCGEVVANPAWQPLPKSIAAVLSTGPLQGTLLTVHPLGGCPMADSWREGVVDSHGAVFDFESGRAASPWEGSLIVLDGSIVPGSLGANPALTIAALSLRAARHWRSVWGWSEGAVDRAVGERPVYRVPAECTKPADQVQPTEVQIIERLVGPVRLAAEGGVKDCIAELTLGFRPRPLHELNRGGPQVLELVQDTDPGAPNRLRLYDKATWEREHLHAQDDDKRVPHALLQARLGGTLELLHREPSHWLARALRGFAAYTLNRGLRDVAQYLLERARGPDAGGPGLFKRIRQAFALATHAAEVRRFDYRLRIEAIESGTHERLLGEGETLHGVKRFTYECGANPWNQLLYLSLERMPRLVEGAPKPQLKLDAAFLAHRGVPLMRITRQEDQPSALADMASFAAYWLRLMVSVHLWSFRAPDPQPLRRPQRLPGALAGLPPPEVHEIALRSTEGPIRVRLTRYRGASRTSQPLLMIHGYSASGTTFAHPALKPSMAEWFWRRGRDIWIVDLRTSAGMPTATLPWTFEQAARADIPMAVDFIVRQVARERACGEAAVQVDIFAHCIGAVMLSMALLSATPKAPRHKPLPAQKEALRRLPERIRRVVLSQKGFALQYSTANVLRAYVLRYLKPLLLPEGYKFRPSPVAPSNQEQLLDRFLSALPYPAEEFRRENPLLPWKRTPWAATRHRMDALYERTFSVNQVSDEVLACIDDFFGPLSTETVSQTIHFARYRAITNQYGRNIFVTGKALQRWPRAGTMSIHAADNGMVDPYTQQLMRDAMGKAGVPFYAAPRLAGGHQDCLIGVQAEETFRQVAEFLDAPDIGEFLAAKGQPVPPPSRALELTPPWMGPRLHRTPAMPQRVKQANGPAPQVPGGTVQLLIAANPAGAQASAIVVPVAREGGGFRPLYPPSHGYPATPIVTYRGWLSVDMPDLTAFTGRDLGYLVLVHAPYANSAHWQPMNVYKSLQQAIPGEQVAAEIARHGATYEKAFVTLADVEAARQGEYEPVRLRLLLTSCQYPAGILDAAPAHESLERLAVACGGADAVLMVGDQIYADATAGLLDPARLDDQYGKSYEAWLRTDPLRRLMRRVPVHMTLDDHEIMDNWGPGAGSSGPGSSPQEAERKKQVALREFWYYQRAARPSGPYASPWYRVKVNGFEVFMADTRSQRQRQPAQLMDSTQWQGLDLWLTARRDEDLRRVELGQPHPQPKFLACGSWLAPRRLGAAGRAEVPERCDGWEAVPQDAATLLCKIAEEGVRGVVLLSGDAHVGCWAELEVRARDGSGTPLTVICLYAPAMYAPFPFANARRQDFIHRERINLNGQYECQVTSHWPDGGDGFMDVTAELGPHGWTLGARMEGAAGPGAARQWLLR
jgi:cholesterol oxidase